MCLSDKRIDAKKMTSLLTAKRCLFKTKKSRGVFMDQESKRLLSDRKRKTYWKKWGPYVAERHWGTVREDFSENGDAWNYLTFDASHARAYRYGEDGIAGVCDTHQILCLAHTFWNEKDEILKEKMFGLNNSEGNHGEDIKELFYYLENTPTHSYMRYLYKYPQGAFPYAKLREENRRRSQKEKEFELVDTGVFANDRYFDIFIEYAKQTPTDLFVNITIHNRGSQAAKLHYLPTVWFRNTWSWDGLKTKPKIQLEDQQDVVGLVCSCEELAQYTLYGTKPCEVLFTENETNWKKIDGRQNTSPHLKDAFHEYLVKKNSEAISPALQGTKAALHYVLEIPPHQAQTLTLRFVEGKGHAKVLSQAQDVVAKRKKEMEKFYEKLAPTKLTEDEMHILKSALSGMLWSKQYYLYPVDQWLLGDKSTNPPGFVRKNPRNKDWGHLYNEDILSIPDKWEYPWFAAWDLAFHTIPLARLDPDFAKKQLIVLTREWFMHPNGQLPAYEWNFGDVNPPVHAWAAWRVYKMDKKQTGKPDYAFLESIFQKLLLNFTWWVNRQDSEGRNIFKGGFLGLDNISVFNRSSQLPCGAILYQSDATSWMGMFAANMLAIAIELSKYNKAYEDMASKFYLHFLHIAQAINFENEHMPPLWNEQEGFYFDLLIFPNAQALPLKVKSLVGILPLLAITTIEKEDLERMTGFVKRFHWFIEHRKNLWEKMASLTAKGVEGRRIISIVNIERLKKILKVLLDEKEFLGEFGLRSISKIHQNQPFSLDIGGKRYTVDYEPGESTTRLFGGNSNWRGPIWMPVNILIIEALQKFHHYLGDSFKVECPTGSGVYKTLWEVSLEISSRLVKIFAKDSHGKRAVFGDYEKFQEDPNFQDHIMFHEYFHGDTGEGLGASHQTGWSGLIAKILFQLGKYR